MAQGCLKESKPKEYVREFYHINVGGNLYEISRDTMLSVSGSRLYRITKDNKCGLLFERHREAFESILAYHQTGQLHMPGNVCPGAFKQEMEFWGVNPDLMENCCYHRYVTFLKDQDIMNGFLAQKEKTMLALLSDKSARISRLRARMWSVLDNRDDSRATKIYFCVATAFILIAIFATALGTLRNTNIITYTNINTTAETNFTPRENTHITGLKVMPSAFPMHRRVLRSFSEKEHLDKLLSRSLLEQTDLSERKDGDRLNSHQTERMNTAPNERVRQLLAFMLLWAQVEQSHTHRLYNHIFHPGLDTNRNLAPGAEAPGKDEHIRNQQMSSEVEKSQQWNKEKQTERTTKKAQQGNTENLRTGKIENRQQGKAEKHKDGKTEKIQQGNLEKHQQVRTDKHETVHFRLHERRNTDQQKYNTVKKRQGNIKPYYEKHQQKNHEKYNQGQFDKTQGDFVNDVASERKNKMSRKVFGKDELRSLNVRSREMMIISNTFDDNLKHLLITFLLSKRGNEPSQDRHHIRMSRSLDSVDENKTMAYGNITTNISGISGNDENLTKYVDYDEVTLPASINYERRILNKNNATLKESSNISRSHEEYDVFEFVTRDNTSLDINPDLYDGARYFDKVKDAIDTIFPETPTSKVRTMETTEDESQMAYVYIEYATNAFFTCELCFRVLSCPRAIKYFFSFQNVIDMLVLAAVYTRGIVILLDAEDSLGYIDILLYIQMFRVLRLLRLLKNVTAYKVLCYAMRVGKKDVFLIVLYVFIGVLFFSNFIYFFEKNEDFPSIPDAWWWSIVTITTVGYGDMAPKTVIGKIIGSVCALSGVFMFSLIIPIFVNTFLSIYQYAEIRNLNDALASKRNTEVQKTATLRSTEFQDHKSKR